MKIKLGRNSAESFRISASPFSIIELSFLGLNDSVTCYQLNDTNLQCIKTHEDNGWNSNMIKQLDFCKNGGRLETVIVLENGMDYILIVNKGEQCEIEYELYINPSIFNNPYENMSTSGFL